MRPQLCVVSVVVASAVFLLAADSWEGKPFTAWNEKECTSILTKSPWAFANSFGDVANLGMIETGARGEREQTVTLRFRFLSAKPVRMAFTRLQLLKNPAGAPPEDKLRELVDSAADPQNRIALQIEFSVDPPSAMELRRLHSFLLNASIANFRDNTRLESSNKVMVVPIEYLAPNPKRSNGCLIFPRTNEKGESLLTGQEKWISFRTDISGYKVFYRWKPENMKFEGKLEL